MFGRRPTGLLYKYTLSNDEINNSFFFLSFLQSTSTIVIDSNTQISFKFAIKRLKCVITCTCRPTFVYYLSNTSIDNYCTQWLPGQPWVRSTSHRLRICFAGVFVVCPSLDYSHKSLLPVISNKDVSQLPHFINFKT